MKDTDIVDVVAGYSDRNNNLLFRLRNGELVTVEEYISQKVAEQIKQHFGVEE